MEKLKRDDLMRSKINERKQLIADYIDEYYKQYADYPSEKDIENGTGIPAVSVHRCLVTMRDEGMIGYDGRRSIRTMQMDHTLSENIAPLLGSVACGPGHEEEESFTEYVQLPERLVGRGEFFVLIAKGESMVDVGIKPGDYVIVRRQQTANNNDLIIALLDGKNNLKKLITDEGPVPILRSCNSAYPELYQDIPAPELLIQGKVVGVYHSIE